MTDMTFVSRRDRRRQTRPSLAQAVASNAGTVGRGAAAAVAASGLVLSSGVAANAGTDFDAPEVTTLDVPASGLSVERASSISSVAVTASQDLQLSFDRPVVTSTPAPEPEPTPEPAPVEEEVEEAVPASLPTQPEAPAQQAEPAPQEQQASAAQPSNTQQGSSNQQSSQSSTERSSATQQGGNNGQARQSSNSQQTSQASTGQQSQGNTQVASSAPAQQQAPTSSSGGNGSVVGSAYAGLGNPYSLGGKTPAGWDCSGFVAWAYAQAGISIPSQSHAMMGSSALRQVSSPSPGDIVVQNGGSHVAIYVGNGQLIGANNPRVGTVQYPLNSPYWSNTMYLSAN